MSEKLVEHLELIRIKKVIERTGMGRSTIYDLVKQGKFPKPVTLVEGGTSVAWVSSEVDSYLQNRIEIRDRAMDSPNA